MGHFKDKHGRYNRDDPAELHPSICTRCGQRVYSILDHNVAFHPDPQQTLLVPETKGESGEAADAENAAYR